MIVFSILALFSARYRPLAKEAFDCVFRRVTLRKCESGLDVRVKSKIVGKIMQKSPKLAKPIYKHFETISWFFVILFFVSLIFTANAVYNIIAYNNCNGPGDDSGYCIITGTGGEHIENAIEMQNDSAILNCNDPLCESGDCQTCGPDCNCTKCD